MRYLASLFAILLLAASTTPLYTQNITQAVGRTHLTAPEKEKATVDSVVQFLIFAAATDFHAHGPSGPLRFREVRIGHVMTANAEKQYRLCGQFMRTQQGVASQWTPFATIKTSGYEQWIGDRAAAFCQDSSFVWENVDDLSSSLQSRFDTIR